MPTLVASTFINSIKIELLARVLEHVGADVEPFRAIKLGRSFGRRAALLLEEIDPTARDDCLSLFDRCEQFVGDRADLQLIEACYDNELLRDRLVRLENIRQRALLLWLEDPDAFVEAEHRFNCAHYRLTRFYDLYDVIGETPRQCADADWRALESALSESNPMRREVEVEPFDLRGGELMLAIASASAPKLFRFFRNGRTEERPFREAVSATAIYAPKEKRLEIAGKFWQRKGRQDIADLIVAAMFGEDGEARRCKPKTLDLSGVVGRDSFDVSPGDRIDSIRLVRVRVRNPFDRRVTEEISCRAGVDLWSVYEASRPDGAMEWLRDGDLLMIEFHVEMEREEGQAKPQRFNIVFHQNGRTNLRDQTEAHRLIANEYAERLGVREQAADSPLVEADNAA